jgi:acetolactate synthase-1/2/3 large subunit
MQSGPGSENAYGGVAQAYGESVPLLVIPAGYPRRIAHVPPNFNSTITMAHVAKHAEPITSGADIENVMRRAFSLLRNGRGSPVIIEFPAEANGEDAPDPLTYEPIKPTRYGPDPAAVKEAAKVLVEAKRPVIYAGHGVHWAEAYDELKELAELLAIPVCTSLQGKSSFDETHPLSLGSGGRAYPRQVRHFLDKCDVLFGIGCSFTETNFGISMPKGKTVIHTTLDPNHLNKDVRCQYGLIGDAKLALRAMIDECSKLVGGKKRDAAPVVAEIKPIADEWLKEWMPKLTQQRGAAQSLPRAVGPAAHGRQGQTRSLPTTPAARATSSRRSGRRPRRTPTSAGARLRSWATASASPWAPSSPCPDKLCINVWGDAAIGFTGMDFETAVRERIPIMSILLNNFSMAIELHIMKVSTEKYRSTDISGDYAAMAKAFGGYGERVTKPEDIIPAIKRGIEQTKKGVPVLLEFITSKEVTISTPK